MLRLTQAIAIAASAIALTATATVPAMAAPRTAAVHQGPEFYLALGDSLSVGDQPNARGTTLPTKQGYVDQLFAVLGHQDAHLQLHKLGCPGETTKTLLKGGICGYSGDHRFSLTAHRGSQMAAALEFLRLHHDVPLITIDIGANDVNACVTPGATIPQIVACLTPVFPAMAKNLTVTLKTLRAADPHATIIGMNYYIPELAAWLTGSAGQTFAKASLLLGVQFNKLLASVYGAAKAQVADVFTAFSSADMKDMVNVPPFGKLPKDVAVICGWTWMCAPKPFGPNIHANKAGYHAIALAFLAKIRHVRDPF